MQRVRQAVRQPAPVRLPDCIAPLEVVYDLEAVRGIFTREAIAAGPANIWRYASLLPIPDGFQPDLPVGFTPLVRAKNLGNRIGANNLYIKNDAVCFPTLSFKDRVVSVALANARSSASTPSAVRPPATSRTR